MNKKNFFWLNGQFQRAGRWEGYVQVAGMNYPNGSQELMVEPSVTQEELINLISINENSEGWSGSVPVFPESRTTHTFGYGSKVRLPRNCKLLLMCMPSPQQFLNCWLSKSKARFPTDEKGFNSCWEMTLAYDVQCSPFSLQFLINMSTILFFWSSLLFWLMFLSIEIAMALLWCTYEESPKCVT